MIFSPATPARTNCSFTNSEMAMNRFTGAVITAVRARSKTFFHEVARKIPLFCIS